MPMSAQQYTKMKIEKTKSALTLIHPHFHFSKKKKGQDRLPKIYFHFEKKTLPF
jgi:hypothetical protein